MTIKKEDTNKKITSPSFQNTLFVASDSLLRSVGLRRNLSVLFFLPRSTRRLDVDYSERAGHTDACAGAVVQTLTS